MISVDVEQPSVHRRQVPISKFVKMLPGEVQEKVKPPPQPIKLIANDLCVNGGKPREVWMSRTSRPATNLFLHSLALHGTPAAYRVCP